MSKSISTKIIPLVAAISTVAVSAYIYFTIMRFKNIPFPWDSAGHAYEGLRIANDLRAGDILSFVADTYRQAFWPFFHSWILAPAFIFFENTYAVARAVSLFCFILFVPTIYLIGIEMGERHGHWAGLINTLLALTSLPLLVLSSMCMSEIPGLLMTFLAFLFYLKAIKREQPSLFLLTSVLMALTFFTKWHHGVFLISAIILARLLSGTRILDKTNTYLFAPLIIILGIWFVYPRHILSFYKHATFQPHFYEFLSIENFLFYPSGFLKIYHSSPIIATLAAFGFLVSLRRIRDPRILPFVIHILIGILLMTYKLDNRYRYIITIVPAIWVLASPELVRIVFSLQSHFKIKPKRTIVSALITLTILFITIASVPGTYRKYPTSLLNYNFYGDEKAGKAYEFITKNVTNHDHIAVFGTWDYYNSLKSSTIRWHIAANRANNFTTNRNKKKKVNFYFKQLLTKRDKSSYFDFVNYLETKDITLYEYHLASFMKTLDPPAYHAYRQNTNINPFTDKIVDTKIINGRITSLIIICNKGEQKLNYYTCHYFANQDKWIQIRKAKFVELGIVITIYELKDAEKHDDTVI
jgi:hypothetical protein